MLTTAGPATAGRPTVPVLRAVHPWCAATEAGPRRQQADAAAGHTGRSGRLAVAVADGVGDSRAAATAATLVADHAVRVAVAEGRVDTALLAAHDLLLSAGDLVRGDAAAVLALGPLPGDDLWTIGWVGDCRAHALDATGALHPLTADHTMAAEMRAAGVDAGGRMEHVLTRSVRTLAGRRAVGTALVRRPGTLLLTSDGAHRVLDAGALTALLGGDGVSARAGAVVAAAAAAGTRDNATALVVDTARTGPSLTGPSPRGRTRRPGPPEGVPRRTGRVVPADAAAASA